MSGSLRRAVGWTGLVLSVFLFPACSVGDGDEAVAESDDNVSNDDDTQTGNDDGSDDDGDDTDDDFVDDDADDDDSDDDSGDDDTLGSFARAATVAEDLDETPAYPPAPVEMYNGASVRRILDPQPRVSDNALAVDDEGNIFIAATTFGEARIYRWDGLEWNRETIGDEALLAQVDLDVNRVPYVVYSGDIDNGSNRVRYSTGFPPTAPQLLFDAGRFDAFLPQVRSDRQGNVHVTFGESMRIWQRSLKIYYAKSDADGMQMEAEYMMRYPESYGDIVYQHGPYMIIDGTDRPVIASCIESVDYDSSYGFYCGLWRPDDGSVETFGPFVDPFPGPLVFEQNGDLISIPIATDYDEAFTYRRRFGNQWMLNSCWPGTLCPDQEVGRGAMATDTEANERIGIATTINTDVLWYISLGDAGNRSWRLQGPRVGMWVALDHDGAGRAHVAFTTGGKLRHGVLDETGDTWSFETVDQGTNIRFVDGGFNPDGELDVCIESNDKEIIYLSTSNDSVSQELVHSRFFDLEQVQLDGCAAAREANGMPWIFFNIQAADWYHFMASSRETNVWSEVALAHDDYAYPPKPLAISGPSGTIHAVWTPNYNPGVYYSRSSGDGTLTTELVDYSSEYLVYAMHESEDGDVFVAVRAFDLPDEAFLLRRDVLGNWSQIATPDDVYISSISTDEDGLIHLLADGRNRQNDCQWLAGNGDGNWASTFLDEDDCTGKMWKDSGGVIRAVYMRRYWNDSLAASVLVEGHLDGPDWITREVSNYGRDAKLLDARMPDEDTIDAVFFMARDVNNTDPTLYRATIPLD